MGKTGNVIIAVGVKHISGVDTLHCVLAEGLSNLGFTVTMLIMGNEKDCDLQLPKNVKCKFIGSPNVVQRILYPRKRDWTRYVLSWRRQQAHEYILAQSPTALIAGHIGYLWMDHTPDIIQIGVIHAADTGNLKTVQQYASHWDACVAVSDDALTAALQEAPQLASIAIVILNGVRVPIEISPKTKGRIQVLIAGRIVQEQKRILDVPVIIQKLTQSHKFEFIVAGDGPQLEELKTDIKEVSTDALISLPGRLPHKTMIDLMRNADVILSTSEYEGTPMAQMEAMAQGCIPVVSTGSGGLTSLVTAHFPENVFQIGDTTRAAEILDRISTQSSEIPEIQKLTHAVLSQSPHTMERMCAGYADVISKALSATSLVD